MLWPEPNGKGKFEYPIDINNNLFTTRQRLKLNKHIQTVLKDDLLGFGEMVFNHPRVAWAYHKDKNRMHLWVKKLPTENSPEPYFTESDVKDILEELSPEDLGPDTWMEGNLDVISLYSGNIEELKIDQLEVVPRVIQILSEINVKI
jgi:hypothetical protein